jgi:membrane fusion protein (multidrug efflux system)
MNTQFPEPTAVDPRDEARNRRAARLKPVGLSLVLALALGGLYLWYEGRNIETTDDAYIDGRAMIVSPRVSGNVISLDARDNQFVRQGQVLLRIDPRQYQFERDLAAGALASAKAQLAPQQSPATQGAGEIEKQNGQLQGMVQQAQARLDQADLNLSWTELRAPQDGWITKRNVELGNVIAPGQPLFSIVGRERWVTANFKESQLQRMRAGQKVKIDVDAFPDLKLEGHVDSIQQGTGSKFTAFPPENATGNFVKVVQRVPVKIVIDSGLDLNAPLPLGLSVVPTVALN